MSSDLGAVDWSGESNNISKEQTVPAHDARHIIIVPEHVPSQIKYLRSVDMLRIDAECFIRATVNNQHYVVRI